MLHPLLYGPALIVGEKVLKPGCRFLLRVQRLLSRRGAACAPATSHRRLSGARGVPFIDPPFVFTRTMCAQQRIYAQWLAQIYFRNSGGHHAHLA